MSFDLTNFDKKIKTSKWEELTIQDWLHIYNAGLNSEDELCSKIKGNWFDVAKDNQNFLFNLLANLYFVDTYLINHNVKEANFTFQGELVLNTDVSADLLEFRKKYNIAFDESGVFNLWKNFLMTGARTQKTNENCRIYTEIKPVVGESFTSIDKLSLNEVDGTLIMNGFECFLEVKQENQNTTKTRRNR